MSDDNLMNDIGVLTVGMEHFGPNTGAYSATQLLVGKVIARQVHGNDMDGGQLFNLVASSVPVPMKQVQGDPKDPTKWADVNNHEVWLVAHSLPSGTQEQMRLLEELKGTEGVRAFTVHNLTMTERLKVAKAAKDHPRDDNDMKLALNNYFNDAKLNNGLTIGFIDKHQAIGTNDFAKNVHRVIAIGCWAPHELLQFHHRLVRACVLVDGDIVAKEAVCHHIASPFQEILFCPKNLRNLSGATLSEEVTATLEELKEQIGEEDAEARDQYRAIEDSAKHLAKTQLPGAVEAFLDLAKEKVTEGHEMDAEYAKVNYEERFMHHEDCTKDPVTEKVTSCCEDCTSVFKKHA